MNKTEENVFARFRLLNEQRQKQLNENKYKRAPDKMKRIMPPRTARRILRDV